MKTTQSLTVAMSDMFRAIAGSPEAQFDIIACTIYSAAYSLMQAGNKTQFNKLHADAKMYGNDSTEANKAIKDALGVKTLTAGAKHFRKVYFSIAVALDQLGMPVDMQKELPKDKAARDVILAPLASDYADQFATVFTVNMSLTEKTDAERTAAKAEADAKRDAKKAAALQAAEELKAQENEQESAMQEAIQAEAKRIASAMAAPSLADMARMVAAAMLAGELDTEAESAIMSAAQVRETSVLLSSMATTPEALAS